jgi:hypothetical protein
MEMKYFIAAHDLSGLRSLAHLFQLTDGGAKEFAPFFERIDTRMRPAAFYAAYLFLANADCNCYAEL